MNWDISLRNRVYRNYWDKIDNIKIFLENLKSTLKIVNDDDWYRVSINDIKLAGGSSILQKYSSFYDCLKSG